MSSILLNERYRLVERIGDGGMAVVYRAQDQRLGREVAVKMLRPQYASDPGFVQRFRREARAAAALNHPHIANVYDTGEDNGRHYIVMELLPPRTLKEEIAQHGSLPVERALDIALQVCQALQHAHSRQLIHRDIKPHNILFTPEGQVKVTDFGIAQALTSDSLTETGTILGSVHYISPEQAQGHPATPQSDLYSLGVVLYEMLTGRLPYQGETPVAVALQHVQGRYVSMRQWNPRIPLAVDQVVQRAMARDPSQRFASAQEMLQALQQVQASLALEPTRVMAPPLERTQVMPAAGPLPAHPRQEPAPRPGRRRSLVGPIAAVVATVAICVGALLWGAGVLRLPAPRPANPANSGSTLLPSPLPPKQVAVPNLLGLLEAEVRERFGAAGWNLVRMGQEDREEPAGTIIWQEPEAGSQVDESRRTIKYRISTGKVRVTVPDVIGRTEDQAIASLEEAGLTVGDRSEEASDKVPAGQVIRQRPAGGQRVEAGSKIHLVISSGPPLPPPPPPLDVVFSQAEDPETGQRSITLLLQAPADAPPQHVRVTFSDDQHSEEEALNRDFLPGTEDRVSLTTTGSTTVRIYVDGKLFQEESFGERENG